MKICAIGDPHGDLKKIKKIPLKGVDLILLTGDLGSSDKIRKIVFENIDRRKKGKPELEISNKFYRDDYVHRVKTSLEIVRYLAQKAPVFIVFGNIDMNNASTKRYGKNLGYKLPHLYDGIKKIKNAHIVNNRLRNVDGVTFGCLEYFIDTCWVKEFKPPEYKLRMKSAKKQTDKVKKILSWFGKVDILLAHQPPFGILDKATHKALPKEWKGKHAGSKAILDYVKKKQPKYLFCGHIHESSGKRKIGKTTVYNLGMAEHIVLDV